MPELTNVSETLMDEAYAASKKFLSSVLFVDDEIKMEESTGTGLSATNITDAFAAESIVPSFYSYSHEDQYEKILTLIRKTDVFVLDWKMSVKRANAEKNPDADADPDGDRGFFAKQLIEALREDDSLGPRLIFIYTSEFDEVVKYIKSLSEQKYRSGETVETAALGGDSEADLSKDATEEIRPATGCKEAVEWVSTNGNVRICAYFKESLKDNHGVDQSRVLTEAQLAEFVLKEYAKLHEGILPVTLLRLLATVRDNTRSLMAKYNSRLDQAFVIDRAMTPEPLDADRMLIGMMLNSVSALNNEADMPWSNELGLVGQWLREKDINLGKLRLNNKETGIQDLVNWQSSGYKNFLFGTWPDNDSLEKRENKFKQYEKFQFLKDVMQVFSVKGLNFSEVSTMCRDYAVLSQWKRVAGGCRAIPILTLGTVLQQQDKGEYYLCIQPSCDTYRIPSEGRDFLFLPLEEGKKDFDIILAGTGEAVRGLKVSMNPYDLVKVKFQPCELSDTVVRAKPDQNGCFCFAASERDSRGNAIMYNWVGDLIETHAIKIVHDYISKLGRVGINESEWLRRS